MFITALCPTYRHPELLANSLALWLAQDYPKDHCHLVILDDGDTFEDQQGENWSLYSTQHRLNSLPRKYNTLLGLAPEKSDAFVVWEDDDIYLPQYLATHAHCLKTNQLSKPRFVLSDYTRSIQTEAAEGRFHSTLGFRRSLIEKIGGWPETDRADFDQQLMNKLFRNVDSAGDPWEGLSACDMPFIYSWHTGAAHCQSTMLGADDTTWYARGAVAYKPVPYVGQLVPQYDARTKAILTSLGVQPCV